MPFHGFEISDFQHEKVWMTHTVTAGPMKLTWDPATRVAHLRMSGEGTGAQARVFTDALTDWIGHGGGQFALLADTSTAEEKMLDWRTEWGKFYVSHREDGVIAVFGATPAVQAAAALFAAGVGVRLKMFGSQDEALAWLRETGFQP